MTPLFCDAIEIVGISPQRALDKLARAGIEVYDVRKTGAASLNLRVKCKETEKIFAIFSGSCYTVTKKGQLRLKRLAGRAVKRVGAVAGALLVLLCAMAGNAFVLRVEVEGSGARYDERAREILAEEGVKTFRLYDEESAENARVRMLALPGIVFAELEKSGCVLTVTLEESEEISPPARETVLVAPASGVVEELTVLRGTALVAEGDTVVAGQTLADGFFLTEDGERRETFAIARCSILCEYTQSVREDSNDEDAREDAIAAAHMNAGGELVESEATAHADGDGFIFEVRLCVRIRASVNME